MKKITAYINTVRVHWLVEELEAIGVNEMMVTEYFSPSSKISRMELLTEDDSVEAVREVVHRVGTTGEPADHSLFIEEYDPKLPSQIPLGRRTSKLEETRMKQLVHFLLRGTHRKIRESFLLIAASVLAVGLYIYVQATVVQRSVKQTVEAIQHIAESTHDLESAMLEEMLAMERFHRGEAIVAFKDFRKARVKLINAIMSLKETNAVAQATIDSLGKLEHRFHFIAGGMFDMVDSLSRYNATSRRAMTKALAASHNSIMTSLDDVRLELLGLLVSVETEAGKQTLQQQMEMNQVIEAVKISLLLLAAGTIVITVMIWLLLERKVARPIRKLVEEAKTVDTTELQ